MRVVSRASELTDQLAVVDLLIAAGADLDAVEHAGQTALMHAAHSMGDSKASLVEGVPHRGDEPHLVREILRTYQVLISAFAQETGLPASRFALMRLLASEERGFGIVDLARQLEINPAAVRRQVQDLEGQSLVRRRADERDGRRSYVSLSPKGVRLFKQANDRTHEFERSLSAVASVAEMQSAAKVLAKLRTFIEGLNRGQQGGRK